MQLTNSSEPLIKPQWYMKMEPLAKVAMDVVRSGEIKIRPELAEKVYFRWMDSINDWCLSRQLWWGHQIPMYFATVEGETVDRADSTRWFSGRTEDEAMEKAKIALGDKKFTLTQEEDVLDTWFSSGLWPYVHRSIVWFQAQHESLTPLLLIVSRLLGGPINRHRSTSRSSSLRLFWRRVWTCKFSFFPVTRRLPILTPHAASSFGSAA
jgi:valyl-tRNA synthetase